MNAVIKCPGAKWSLAEWIIARFPPHHSYLEPFFGSGAVLFNKERSNILNRKQEVQQIWRTLRALPNAICGVYEGLAAACATAATAFSNFAASMRRQGDG